MKILQIHNFYQIPGGEDSVVKAERSLLESRGHVVIPYYKHNNTIKAYGLSEKIRFLCDALYSNKTVSELRRIAKDEMPDVAHIHNVFPLISPSAYYAFRSFNIPIVQTIHNYRFLCPSATFYKKKSICRSCIRGNTLHCFFSRCYKGSFILSALYSVLFLVHRHAGTFRNNVDLFIALNNFTKNLFINCGFPDEKIMIVRNFLPNSQFEQLPEKESYAVYIGRLSQEKGLWTLLSAVKKVNGLRIKILGIGELEQRLRDYVKQNEMTQVEFKGFVFGPDKMDILRKAVFSIVPSEWYESFGIVVLESFAAGTPVIASNIGGLPELVDDGKSGLLFRPGDADDLAEKMGKMLRDPGKTREMGLYARGQVEQKYNQQTHYEELLDVYNAAIGNEKGACNGLGHMARKTR